MKVADHLGAPTIRLRDRVDAVDEDRAALWLPRFAPDRPALRPTARPGDRR